MSLVKAEEDPAELATKVILGVVQGELVQLLFNSVKVHAALEEVPPEKAQLAPAKAAQDLWSWMWAVARPISACSG